MSAGKLGSRKGNTFELVGFDFLIDASLRPWLLEINSSPSMDYSTPITERMVKSVFEDCAKIIVDREEDGSENTGNFELIYKKSRQN